MIHTPTLYVIDGGEGVGKTTLLSKLREAYPDALFTREPGGTPLGEDVRTLILGDKGETAGDFARHSLFWAARSDHVERLIIPTLKTKHTFSDRFDSSTFAYQIQHRLHPLHELFWQTRKVYLHGLVPHYIILDVDEATAQERVKSRGGVLTHFDAQKIEFHKKVREGFRRFGKYLEEGWGEGTITFVDAGCSPEEVFRDVQKEIV